MSEPLPAYAQEAYAILRNRFAEGSFPADYLSWFISRNMAKKTLFVLEHAGWIRRERRGSYVCVNADDAFRSMLEYKVPKLLLESGMRYAYAGASAVEVWTDFSYVQRSWEHSPYRVKVLEGDLKKWVGIFRSHRVKASVLKPEAALGESVVLEPVKRLSPVSHGGLPVEPLDEVVRYCERHLEAFEYPLAYLVAKFKLKPTVDIDGRVLTEAAKAVS